MHGPQTSGPDDALLIGPDQDVQNVQDVLVEPPITDVAASPAGGAASKRLPAFATRHLLAIVVLVVVGAVGIGTALALRGVVHSQEQRLLKERAAEVAAYLKSTTTQTSSTLIAAGEAVALGGGTTNLFTALATPLTVNGATVGVAQRSGGAWTVQAVVGQRATVGRPVSTLQLREIQRALATPGLAFDLINQPDGRHLVEALDVPGTPTRTVVIYETILPAPKPITPTKDSPYHELNVALYVGAKPDRDKVVLISGDPIKAGDKPARAVLDLGASSALILITSHGPLVGSFAQSVPWIVLAASLVLAALLALLVEVLTRRRAYALNLVEQRTREMHRAQLAAEAANRSKSEFLSRMSHELRTPLNAVLGFSQLLEFDHLTQDQEAAVGQITKGGRHLLDLINEVLDISQIETGNLALSPEAVNTAEVIRETIDLVRPLASDRGIHLLGGDPSGCDVYVFADRQRLKQILLNLLGNGIKYNRDGGTVSISCVRPTAGRMRIQVTDTGPGIPESQFGLLFTPFERLGADQTTVEGTGIGLALSRRLAEVMGGTLGVESTVGRGSTFWVEFPLVEGPVARLERIGALGATDVVDAAEAQRPSVLHIEDNLSNIQLIERILAQRPGVRLIPAMQGRLGLELARQHRPILILLDLNLADVAGEDVLLALRDDPATAQIPVAIVSADAMPRQVQRLLAAGATAYLTKPIDVHGLLELLDRAIAADQRRSAAPVGVPASESGE